MTNSPSDVCAYAYELPNPYRSEGGGSSTLILDQPLRVGDRMKRSFPDTGQDPATEQWTSTPGPEREWEVIAIEPTARDGEVATIRGYMRDKPPIAHGRLIVRALG